VPRLRRSTCASPGIERRRRGRGFSYLAPDGRRVDDPEVLQRIDELTIPPAWREVWICLDPLGHLQATGVDAAGRKQYRYHDQWRAHRDRQKFDSMVGFGTALPRLRRRVARDLKREPLSREQVLAAAIRLLDLGFFRIGSEDYAEQNESYGLTTMRRSHVSLCDDEIVFDYQAKSGIRRVQAIADPQVRDIVAKLKRRRGGGDLLLVYRSPRGFAELHADQVNSYLKQIAGEDFSAKDFRTWNATVLAAVALAAGPTSPARERATRAATQAARERAVRAAASQAAHERAVREPASQAARERAVRAAIKTVAAYLGNTPAVCRASYVDPRVIDRFHAGTTIAAALDGRRGGPNLANSATRTRIEAAVVELLDDAPAVRAAA